MIDLTCEDYMDLMARYPDKYFDLAIVDPPDGCRMGKETGEHKIHPHQKPVELYVKILKKYSKPGWSILDTHMGSGSSVTACHKLGLDVTACEIDPHYFKAAKKRINFETRHVELFPTELRSFQERFLFEGLKEAQ